MIERMLKLVVVVQGQEREHLLSILHRIGIVHLEAFDLKDSSSSEELANQIAQTEQALQILTHVNAAGENPAVKENELAANILEAQAELSGLRREESAMRRQLQRQSFWGDIRSEALEELREAGVKLRFYRVPPDGLSKLHGDFLHVCGPLEGGGVLAALAGEPVELEPQPGFEELVFPKKDSVVLRKELDATRHAIAAVQQRLAQLAQQREMLEQHLLMLREKLDFQLALEGGHVKGELFAVQGWCPAVRGQELDATLLKEKLCCARILLPPGPDDNPPTLLRHPRWTRPIAGLFQILNTLPGYREYDLSGFFMIALPIFAAIILGDAGYGLVLLLLGGLLARRKSAAAASEKIQLLLVIGAMTLVYGVLVGSYFGLSPESMALFGGYVQEIGGQRTADIAAMQQGTDIWAVFGKFMLAAGPFWEPEANALRIMLMKVSFVLGCLHLVSARLQRFFGYFPNQKAYAELGWCLFLVGMLGLIWILFLGAAELPVPHEVVIALLAVGALCAVLFTVPQRNFLKRVFYGVAASLLSWLGAFSDMMSYIRLMAVGLASYYIALVTNQLAADASSAVWWGAAVFIIVVGHGINIALGAIAIFAHGVRLNMLEFSNNAGVQWSGYTYAPFASRVSTGE